MISKKETVSATIDSVRDLRTETIKRLGLWLVIGHGAGFLAVASKFSEMEVSYAAILLPSMWAFSFGLVSSFAMHLSLVVEFSDQIDSIQKGVAYKADKNWKFIGAMSALISILSFLVGIFYPLIFISFSKFELISLGSGAVHVVGG
jgi:hypothetical protein